jgi:hypothetical protein
MPRLTTTGQAGFSHLDSAECDHRAPDGLATPTHAPMFLALQRHPGSSAARSLGLLAAAAFLASAAACHTGPARESARPAARCATGGLLRIGNHTGAAVDVYVTRADAAPQFVSQASPGQTAVEVPGPEDLGVRYDVVEPRSARRLQTVSWIRPMASGGSTSVLVELVCAPDPS